MKKPSRREARKAELDARRAVQLEEKRDRERRVKEERDAHAARLAANPSAPVWVEGLGVRVPPAPVAYGAGSVGAYFDAEHPDDERGPMDALTFFAFQADPNRPSVLRRHGHIEARVTAAQAAQDVEWALGETGGAYVITRNDVSAASLADALRGLADALDAARKGGAGAPMPGTLH